MIKRDRNNQTACNGGKQERMDSKHNKMKNESTQITIFKWKFAYHNSWQKDDRWNRILNWRKKGGKTMR